MLLNSVVPNSSNKTDEARSTDPSRSNPSFIRLSTFRNKRNPANIATIPNGTFIKNKPGHPYIQVKSHR